MKKVTVIVLTWNQPQYTIPCVNSVIKQECRIPFEVFIVDNGSHDDSVKQFNEHFGKNKQIRIIEAGSNLGYTGGNNLGVSRSDADYIVILNNDTVVEEGWLDELVRVLESDDSIGAVNAYEIRNGKEVGKDYLRKYRSRINMLQYGVVEKRDIPLKVVDVLDAYTIKGCSFIYRKDIKNPPFDDDYFLYAEETKFGWLMRCMGHKIKQAVNARVNHFHNVTKKENKGFSKFAVYLGERNKVMNILTFYDIPRTLLVIPLLAAQTLAVLLLRPKELPYRLKAYWYLLTHIPLMIRKRKEIAEVKKVSNKELYAPMTWKLGPRSASFYKK